MDYASACITEHIKEELAEKVKVPAQRPYWRAGNTGDSARIFAEAYAGDTKLRIFLTIDRAYLKDKFFAHCAGKRIPGPLFAVYR